MSASDVTLTRAFRLTETDSPAAKCEHAGPQVDEDNS
jgi:hypothetical protein